MVFWNETEIDNIETVLTGRERTKFRYNGGPLRFQIPRGMCTWGVSAYRSLNIDVPNPEFIAWWRDLEARLCTNTPFNSNLKDASLRLKIDEASYIFDQNSKQICPDIREGLFRGQEVSCIIDIDSTYFFNGNWGLTVRIYQLKTLSDPVIAPSVVESAPSEISLPKGICAFLSET